MEKRIDIRTVADVLEQGQRCNGRDVRTEKWEADNEI